MSRSGYVDDMDDRWALIRWRGVVASAIRGKRGQAFLKEMLVAMDALPERKLVRDMLEANGAVCAIGSVGKARGVSMDDIDPEDYEGVAAVFGITTPLAQEIMWTNDNTFWRETPEQRFEKMWAWVDSHIRKPKPLWFW